MSRAQDVPGNAAGKPPEPAQAGDRSRIFPGDTHGVPGRASVVPATPPLGTHPCHCPPAWGTSLRTEGAAPAAPQGASQQGDRGLSPLCQHTGGWVTTGVGTNGEDSHPHPGLMSPNHFAGVRPPQGQVRGHPTALRGSQSPRGTPLPTAPAPALPAPIWILVQPGRRNMAPGTQRHRGQDRAPEPGGTVSRPHHGSSQAQRLHPQHQSPGGGSPGPPICPWPLPVSPSGPRSRPQRKHLFPVHGAAAQGGQQERTSCLSAGYL